MSTATLQAYVCHVCHRHRGGNFLNPPTCPVCRQKMKLNTEKRPFRGVPMIGSTDDSFMRGLGHDDGFLGDEMLGGMARANARAHGVNPTGKKFFSQLCRNGMPLDPLAWQDGRHNVAKRVRELGKGCEGAVNVPVPADNTPHPLDKPYQVAPDIVAEDVQEINEEHYEGRMPTKDKTELTEKLTKRYTGNK